MQRKQQLNDSKVYKICGLVLIIGQSMGNGNGETLTLILMVLIFSYLKCLARVAFLPEYLCAEIPVQYYNTIKN